MKEYIQIEEITIEIEKKKIKNIHLKVYPDGRVYISAPIRVSKRFLTEFARDRLSWIREKKAECESHPESFVKPDNQSEQELWVYRRILTERIPPLIRKWEPVMGVKVFEWHIKNMKTRWGTCNVQAHRIWINLQLARFPEECLEYIVVHEMIHLLERGHGPAFYAYMNRFLPEWKKYDQMLKPL